MNPIRSDHLQRSMRQLADNSLRQIRQPKRTLLGSLKRFKCFHNLELQGFQENAQKWPNSELD